MPATPTYSPLISQNSAECLWTNTCRYAESFRIEGNLSDATHPTPNSQLLTPNWSFIFSAKERDSETGLSYFGSRYYSSDLSIWLSVDPMSDKYASLSPYVYCADNPVRFVDPNGEEIGDYYSFNGTYLGSDGKNDNKLYQQSENGDVIYGLGVLNKPKSARLFYKDISKIRLQDEISSYNPFGYSYIAFVNKDTSQYLIAFAHDGDVINSFSAFEIGYVTSGFLKVVNNYYATDYFLFETESGLRLNMPLDQLFDLKGECYLNKYGNTFFHVIEADKSIFVQKYKHPEYYMRFTVENEAVSKIMH